MSYNFPMNPAIFLDRDGVIIENRASYVRGWEDVSFYPQALEALSKLRSCPYLIIVVTNQSCIGRGIVTLENAININRKIIAYIQQAGGRIDDVFMCPHSPTDRCACRKPLPGLLLQAAEEHDIDLKNSTMIGDAITDIKAGQAVQIGQTVLVRTGRGIAQMESLEKPLQQPFRVHANLLDACINMFSQEPWWGT